jgi:hypothetical protein
LKRNLIIALVFAVCAQLNAQTDYKYQSLIAEAGLLHLQKKPDKAIAKFEEALNIKKLDALNLYKLAGVYSLAHQSGKAFYTLEKSIDMGWTEANRLTSDPYFQFLKTEFPERWEQMVIKAHDVENKYAKTLKYPELRRQINQMTLIDQELRFRKIQTNDPEEIRKLNAQIDSSDLRNLGEAKAILKTYGWPRLSDVGKDGQNNFWLIVQHADQDIPFQKWALAEMKKHKATDEIDLENYAFLYDRVQCNLNYRQRYGTQVNWSSNGQANSFRPILNEDVVNERRKSLGLLPLDIYALNYGFAYTAISTAQASENERDDQIETKKLIDSAKSAYQTKEFQNAYDYYNKASTIMGGMSDDQNSEAALLFAEIYNLTHEDQYREIALDFLTLAFYRDKLNSSLKTKSEFDSFHDHDRWKQIVK